MIHQVPSPQLNTVKSPFNLPSSLISEEGKLKGDLTVFNWGDGTWWIMGSYYLRAWHMRWFNDHLSDGISIKDLGEDKPINRNVFEEL